MAMVRRIVDELTTDGLERSCIRPPAPGYPDQPRTVRQCIRVVMNEECEHYRYAMRDLAVLESGREIPSCDGFRVRISAATMISNARAIEMIFMGAHGNLRR